MLAPPLVGDAPLRVPLIYVKQGVEKVFCLWEQKVQNSEVKAHLDMAQLHSATSRAGTINRRRVPLPICDRPRDDESRAVIVSRVSNGADFLVLGGKEDRSLDKVVGTRT